MEEKPMTWALAFLLINLLSFFLYGLDKWKAVYGRWRISERTLLLAALAAGFAGALIGMYFFHHKTRHKKFVYGVPLIGLLELAAAMLLVL